MGHDAGDVVGDLGLPVVERDETVVALERAQVRVEPLPVRGRLALGRHIGERPETASDMVEDAVEQDPDAPLGRRVDEPSQVVLAAEPWIDTVVVDGVVAVRLGREHRTEREPVAAEPDEMVEPAFEPCQPRRRGGAARQGLAFGAGEPERIGVPPDGVIRPAHARLPTRIAGA